MIYLSIVPPLIAISTLVLDDDRRPSIPIFDISISSGKMNSNSCLESLCLVLSLSHALTSYLPKMIHVSYVSIIVSVFYKCSFEIRKLLHSRCLLDALYFSHLWYSIIISLFTPLICQMAVGVYH